MSTEAERAYVNANGRLTVALNALAAIAQDLGVPAGSEHGADWVGGITAAIRAKIMLVTPSIAARGGLVALSAALTRPQAEHPDVQEACTWIAYITGRETGPTADTTLSRELVRRRLADHCTADSNECAIRRQCTNKCGRMPSEGR